ncbi:hypothetical protein B0H10DRAFT_1944046 [Mycena sp. CBHHK59/15]|nr:hypothetical protein B0H10DRAFT_1944046 [Mycena sp. CBHHK59/15]
MAEELLEASLLDSVDGGSRTPKVTAAPTNGFVFGAEAGLRSGKEEARGGASAGKEGPHGGVVVIEEGSKSRGSRAFLRLMRRIKSRVERAQRILLHRWYSMPWDAGTVSVVAVTAIEAADDVLVGAPRGTADGKVLLQEVEDGGDVPDVEGVRNRSRNASASSPGQCCGTDPLRPKGVARMKRIGGYPLRSWREMRKPKLMGYEQIKSLLRTLVTRVGVRAPGP